jgi:hypothetical protein
MRYQGLTSECRRCEYFKEYAVDTSLDGITPATFTTMKCTLNEWTAEHWNNLLIGVKCSKKKPKNRLMR